MKTFKTTALMFFLLSVLIAPSSSFALGMEAAVGIWKQGPQGNTSFKGEDLSLKDDLKYGDQTRVAGRVRLDMPLMVPNFYFNVTPMKFTGDGNKTVNFKFGDKAFSGNVPFTSEVRLDHYDITMFYGIPALKTASLGKFNIDAGLGIRFMDITAKVKQGALQESKDVTAPVPMVFLAAQVKPLDKLSIEAEFRGISFNANHFYDLTGRAKYRIVGPVFGAAGYRYENIKIDAKDLKAGVKFGGPFAEVGVEF